MKDKSVIELIISLFYTTLITIFLNLCETIYNLRQESYLIKAQLTRVLVFP